jgi:hypothetical protein
MNYNDAVKAKERLQPEHKDGNLFVCPSKISDYENYASHVRDLYLNNELTDKVAITFSSNGKFNVVKLMPSNDAWAFIEFLDIK